MRRVAIFCGSSAGTDKNIHELTNLLADALAAHNIGMVYGAARIGLMGMMADKMLGRSCEVIGIIPKFLMSKEMVNEDIDELLITENMHDRKVMMYDRSDGFIILPGGFGTMDEFFEITTWGQLGLHQKPIGILNMNGFYDSLIAQFDRMVASGFLKPDNKDLILIDERPEQLIEKMMAFEPKQVPKWLNKDRI